MIEFFENIEEIVNKYDMKVVVSDNLSFIMKSDILYLFINQSIVPLLSANVFLQFVPIFEKQLMEYIKNINSDKINFIEKGLIVLMTGILCQKNTQRYKEKNKLTVYYENIEILLEKKGDNIEVKIIKK